MCRGQCFATEMQASATVSGMLNLVTGVMVQTAFSFLKDITGCVAVLLRLSANPRGR